MKRMICTAAMALLLIMILGGESFASMYPYDYARPSTKDDHTWGGDPDGGGGIARAPSTGGSGVITTGNTWMDILFNVGFVEWLYGGRSRGVEQMRYYIIVNASKDNGEGNANVNSKGN